MSMFYVIIYVDGIYPINYFNQLKLYTMLSLCLSFPIAMSDAKDWTNVRKGLAILWVGVLDVLIIGLCCW